MHHSRLNTEIPLSIFVAPAVIASICLSVDATPLSDDPWPFWGRTASRVGNTETIGPQTPRIEWSVQFVDHGDWQNASSPVMDDNGRIFMGHVDGISAVDSLRRELLWTIAGLNVVAKAPTVWMDRVYWGHTGGDFFCSDAATGQKVWIFHSAIGFDTSPVIDPNGIVYFPDRGETLYALNASDGTEVWTADIEDGTFSVPALSWPNLITTGGGSGSFELLAFSPQTGKRLWSFRTGRWVRGLVPHTSNRLYLGGADEFIYCIDTQNGQKIWSLFCDQINLGATALGHDGTIYSACSGGDEFTEVLAISPDGDLIWSFEPGSIVVRAPVVGGNGTIFFCSSSSSPRRGFTTALNSDGSELWSHELPDQCVASPMLAPNGTLFILCRDRNLYAFRDPHLRASITNIDVTTGTILDGGINDIAEPDGSYLHTRSGFGTQLSELHKTELLINATVADPQPAIMRIQIESRTDQPAAMAIVQLRNWTTGNFETVRNYEVESEEEFEWIQIPKGGNGEQIDPQRYIRISGAIEMKLKHIVFVPFLAFTFESFIDQIKIEVTG